MPQTADETGIEPLILDLVEWLAGAPRTYAETMAAWRTSCPRLTIWEDACDRGLVERLRADNGTAMVRATRAGRALLAVNGQPARCTA